MNIATSPVRDRISAATDLVEEWSGEEPQTLVSRWLVIDRLLDIRNLVTGEAQSEVDIILADIPGVTVVEGSWWTEQLRKIAADLDDLVVDRSA